MNISEIDDYQNRLSNKQKNRVISHCKEHDISPVICAWYDDMDDFYSDWVDEVGYTEIAADDLLNDDGGEFLVFKDRQIVRFVM